MVGSGDMFALLEEHGPLFETLREVGHPKCMGGSDCILVKSDSTDWVGWLEIYKIDIIEYYRTPCTSAILRYLGVKEWNESQYKEDCTDILKEHGWIVETAMKIESITVGALRKELKKNRMSSTASYYMVIVPGHVLLLDKYGDTCCDTAPVLRDKRAVRNVYSITSKERASFSSSLAYEMSKIK